MRNKSLKRKQPTDTTRISFAISGRVSKLGESNATKFLHMCTKKQILTTNLTKKNISLSLSNCLSMLSEKAHNKLYFKRTKNSNSLYLFKRVCSARLDLANILDKGIRSL